MSPKFLSFDISEPLFPSGHLRLCAPLIPSTGPSQHRRHQSRAWNTRRSQRRSGEMWKFPWGCAAGAKTIGIVWGNGVLSDDRCSQWWCWLMVDNLIKLPCLPMFKHLRTCRWGCPMDRLAPFSFVQMMPEGLTPPTSKNLAKQYWKSWFCHALHMLVGFGKWCYWIFLHWKRSLFGN